MAGVVGALRSRILTPRSSEVRLRKRGFHTKDAPSTELLETIGLTFLSGFARAAAADDPHEVEEPLRQVPIRFRGFAHEGAAMAFATVDAMRPGRRQRFTAYLAGAGGEHIYMAYIGLGWAMARIPRFRWPSVELDPVLRWLVLDGYGFHQAYFRTSRYVTEGFQDAAFGWPVEGPDWYAARVLDQGIGRALWFVGGTEPDVVADLIERFAPQRRADLFSGAGLAATYAGGADVFELQRFWERAGAFRQQVAQGSAFAAQARRRAGLQVPHTDVATEVFCAMSAEAAAGAALRTLPDAPARGGVPTYEVWRRQLADEFVSLGRC